MSTEDTVSFQIYLNVSHNNFKHFLMGYGANIDMAWFQQDGTRPHTDVIVFGIFYGNICKRSAIKQILCSR
jgi:hypothetical protein